VLHAFVKTVRLFLVFIFFQYSRKSSRLRLKLMFKLFGKKYDVLIILDPCIRS